MSKKSKQNRVPKPNRSIQLSLEHLEDRYAPAVLQVGTLAGDLTFAQAAAAAQNGDTVQVQAGTYTDFDVKWYADNLTIQAVGGPVVLNDSGYTISNEKGIFDIIGNNASVQGITFENAHDFGNDGHNYAGIRDEGVGLTLNACTFLNNDDGLLVTPPSNGVGNVLVEYSVFSNNGYGDGESHNMYINHVNSFTLEYSSTIDAYYGHDVKSRALNTYLLYNFIGDSGSGANDQAALVDLPDGGNSYLIGNVLHKGSSAANGTMIDSNVEGYDDSTQENPTQLLEMVNNTVVNDRSAGNDVLVFGSQTTPVNLINNVFAGLGEEGTGLYSGQNGAPANPATNETNLTAVNPGFVDATSVNYQLTSGSAAINAGTNPGSINGFNLTPTNEYVAVANTEARPVEGPLDIGAYEFVPSGNQPPTVATAAAASAGTVTGTTVNLSVLGADDGGEANLTYSWAVASGPTGVTFSVNGSNAAQSTTATFTQAGSYTFTATITDQEGLSVTSTTGTVMVVQTPTAVGLTPAMATVADRATQQFTATVTDQFGMAISNPAVTWMWTGLGSVSTTGLYTAPASGAGSATVTVTSGAAAQTADVTVTIPPPTVATAAAASAGTVTGTTVNLSVLGADDGGEANLTYSWAVASGPTGVTFSVNGSNAAQSTTATFTQAGSYTFTATITDQELSVISTTATVTVVQTPTAVGLTPAMAKLVDGATQKFTATATDQFGMAISNPAVTWKLSGLGSVSTTGLYTAPASGAGSATITAKSGAVAKTATVTFTIAQASPTVSLTSSSSSVVFGQAVTFVATVTGSGANPTGTVTFYDDGTALGTAPLNGSAVAELTTTALTLNGNSISASYSGATNFLAASSGASTESVARAATQIVFAPQEVFKKKKLVSVELRAEIQPIAPGAGVPTGIVTFEVRAKGKKVKEKLLGTVALSGGSATLSVKLNRVQKQVVTINYGGDADFTASTETTPRLTPAALKELARPM